MVVALAASRPRYCGTVRRGVDRLGVLEERLERDRRRLLARGDQLGGRLVDLLVQRIVEVVRLEEARDAVVRLVVDEDGAEQRLLGLEVVGRGAEGQRLGRGAARLSVGFCVRARSCPEQYIARSESSWRGSVRCPGRPRYSHMRPDIRLAAESSRSIRRRTAEPARLIPVLHRAKAWPANTAGSRRVHERQRIAPLCRCDRCNTAGADCADVVTPYSPAMRGRASIALALGEADARRRACSRA